MTYITSLLFLLLLKLCTIPYSQASTNNNNNAPLPIIKTRRRKLQSGVTIGGSVYYDINKNGKRDANEPGIPNVQVQIRTCTNGRVGNTRTNSGGEFIVELDEPGCYYARLDATAFTFTEGSDIDSTLGKTENVELKEGQAKFWYAGIVPEVGSGITSGPTPAPTVSMAPTVSTLPSMGPTPGPTSGPTTADPTLGPTAGPTTGVPSVAPSVAPSADPTTTSSPTACVVRDVVDENIMSSAPILRSSYGMIFSLSTPDVNETSYGISLGGDSDNISMDDTALEMEYIRITSISLRVLTPLLNQASSTNYQVWYRQGDYKLEDNSTQAFDTRGNFSGWTLVADGNSMGSNPPKDSEDSGNSETTIQIEETTNQPDTTSQEPLVLDSNFLSGVYPSDNNDYKAVPSTLLKDGGMDTLDSGGSRIKTYLYQIPTSIFTAVDIPKYGGKVSFYVTLEKAKLQNGAANEDEWDSIDVENEEYDYGSNNNEDMNVRIHVGEAVNSHPWTDILGFYNPRRFLGKVWYDQITAVPCDMHESAPSQSPTELALPPLPGSGTAPDFGAVGEAVETRFVVSVFLQQDIRDARKMNEEVQEVFRVTMMDFLNEEWVMGHCVWGEALEVEFQKLSLLKGVRHGRRHRHLLRGGAQRQHTFGPLFSKRRQLQTEITILQVEMFIKGLAYDDLRVCPNGAIPATPTTRGDNWDETMAQIGMDYVADNADKLVDDLKESHVYFKEIFAVSADPDLLERPVDMTTVIETTTETKDSTFPLIPIIAAICGAVVILCLLSCLCFRRRRKRQKQEQLTMEDASETPEGIIIVTDTDKGDSDLTKTKEDGDTASEEGGMEQATAGGGVAEESEWTVPVESDDPLMVAWPALRKVPQLEEVIMMRGLPRRRSEPNMATVATSPTVLKRTRSISCIREVWINLNKSWSHDNSELGGGYVDQLLEGTLYPVDDLDILDWERERHLMGEDPSSPYVPHGGSIEHNFIDESEAIRIESPRAAPVTPSVVSDEILSDAGQGEEEVIPPTPEAAPPKINPLVMQQVEMLEAKWKQLKEDYDDDVDSDDEVNLDNFDVNERIEQLMNHIEKLELDRKMRLASLKRQEEEEDELARKRMVRGGGGINYEEELNKDFVIRKKRKKRKSKKVVEEDDSDEISEESSDDEDGEDGEFDVKWMRLKVPLAAQDAGAMRSLVKKGQDLDGSD